VTAQEKRSHIEQQRRAQGLPPRVSDPAALKKIAGLVKTAD
jgi:hypothetical protein